MTDPPATRKTTKITLGGAAPDAGPRPGLVLLYAENLDQLPGGWPFEQGRLLVGSESAVHLHLPARGVSRGHAEIWQQGKTWFVRDLGSTNGTRVDGTAITEAPLEPLSELQMGSAVLKFVDADADAYSGYRLDGVMLPGCSRRCQNGTALVGGYQMDRIAAEIERIAPSELNVLLFGESGTGKEVVAQELHRLSGRSGAFAAVNCAAIPANLVESELFGYKRGAFTGATRDKPGLIRAAHEGTLLLDEIGDMPLEAQAKLLRVLESREVFPIGATAPERVDVRVIGATHRDLSELQARGTFRADLYGRLNEYQLRLPPLRERKEDVHMLLRAFLAQHGRPDLRPSFAYMAALLCHDWPYNVRELVACSKRAVALSSEPTLELAHLPDSIREAWAEYGRASTAPAPMRPPQPQALAAPSPRPTPSAEQLRALLAQHQGNVAAVGRDLGKARMQIHRWMKRYAIDIDEYR